MPFDIAEVQDKFTPLSENALTQSFADIDQKIFQNAQAERSSSSLKMEQGGILPAFSIDTSNDSVGNDGTASKTVFAAGMHSEEGTYREKLSEKASNEKSNNTDTRNLTDWPELLKLLERMKNGEVFPSINFGTPHTRPKEGGKPDAPSRERPAEKGENHGDKPVSNSIRDLTDWPELKRLLRNWKNGEYVPPIKTEGPPRVRPKVEQPEHSKPEVPSAKPGEENKDKPGDYTTMPVEPPASGGGDYTTMPVDPPKNDEGDDYTTMPVDPPKNDEGDDYTTMPVDPPKNDDGDSDTMPVAPPEDDYRDGKPAPVKEMPPPRLGREYPQDPVAGTPEHRNWMKEKLKDRINQIGRDRTHEPAKRQWSR